MADAETQASCTVTTVASKLSHEVNVLKDSSASSSDRPDISVDLNPTTAASTSSSSSNSSQADQCARCKISLSAAKSGKACLKCQSVVYCSRDCQKADFKYHKKLCAAAAQVYASKTNFQMENRSNGGKVSRDGHRGGLQKWQFDT